MGIEGRILSVWWRYIPYQGGTKGHYQVVVGVLSGEGMRGNLSGGIRHGNLSGGGGWIIFPLLAPLCKDGVSHRISHLLPPFVRGELT